MAYRSACTYMADAEMFGPTGSFRDVRFRELDTSATRYFGTTKLVPKFETNHQWSCVSYRNCPGLISIAACFSSITALVSKCLVPRFCCWSVLRSVPKCPRVSWCWSVLWPKCPVTPIQWNHAKCCGADPCCHGNEIWAIGAESSRLYLLVIIIIIIYNPRV